MVVFEPGDLREHIGGEFVGVEVFGETEGVGVGGFVELGACGGERSGLSVSFGAGDRAGNVGELVAWLQGLQDPTTGLFPEPSEPPLDDDPLRVRFDAGTIADPGAKTSSYKLPFRIPIFLSTTGIPR